MQPWVVCELRGPALGEFLRLADLAGDLLPDWPSVPYPDLLGNVPELARRYTRRLTEPAYPVGVVPPVGLVTDHRGNIERWLGYVFQHLLAGRPEHLHLHTRTQNVQALGGEPVNAVLTLCQMNLFTASAHAIELGGLLPSAEAVTLTERELSVLRHLRKRNPALVTNADLEVATELSKVTVRKAVNELIEKKLAARPKGPKKGVTVTDGGIAFLKNLPSVSQNQP